jgi:hypothetical protein
LDRDREANRLTESENTEFGPWNPGISSQLPAALLPLATIFRPENSFVSADQAGELSDFTGLARHELTSFRPERLTLHELLVRVTADFSVPDGPKYEDLGINFRHIVETIMARYLLVHMPEIRKAYDDLKDRVAGIIDQELSQRLFVTAPSPNQKKPRRGLAALFSRSHPSTAPTIPAPPARDVQQALVQWQAMAAATADPVERAAHGALIRTVTAISGRHGGIRGDSQLLAMIAVNIACNDCGSTVIGDMIEPFIKDAIEKEGFRLLPVQARPVVMNIKGASASGKSTMRPLQRKLAEKIGIAWEDFAVISPDIWRKYLLDYGSLGEACKYAGTLTGHELEMIDQKLDRYMADKAEQGRMSHLLIDRFRFDSFASTPDAEEGSNLLTRFGALVYMFFMVTPPEATVERAWYRGLEFGRYKAVDDLLDHNVEAFTGMPRLFFTWALRSDKIVHFEFLDNSVPKDETPRTIAFGRNGDMTILDAKGLIDVQRYQKINIDAQRPDDVYPGAAALAPENNTGFLRQCAEQIPMIKFADRQSGVVFAGVENGTLRWTDPEALDRAMKDPETRAAIEAMAGYSPDSVSAMDNGSQPIDPDFAHTIGEHGHTP